MQIRIAIALSVAFGCGAPPAKPPTASPVAAAHDFDYFEGGWITRQRRLQGTAWEEFPAMLCMQRYVGGTVNAGELVFPTKGWAGVTVRAFDVAQRRWSIYWISSRTGRLGTPLLGTFTGDRGEFHGDDVDDGHPVKVRSTWAKLDRDHARWEQAYSRDGKTWELNWTADFERADPAVVCDNGRPRAASPPATPIPDDFAYFEGGWTTHQRRLKTRGTGSSEWDEFPATLCMKQYLSGLVTIDVAERQWSIYWISSRTGTLGTPVVGKFIGDRGEFFGDDEDAGRKVKVRYRWVKQDRDHARWEQAFSYDGTTWETNWTADFERGDTATLCTAGRPRT
jgi:hypothetical protein